MKYAHIDENGKILGWYAEEVHGTFIEEVYEEKIVQEEIKDKKGIITQEQIKENILIKESYYDISSIPKPNIQVTDEVWKEALESKANYYENNTFILKDTRTEAEKKEALESIFREERNNLLQKTDIEINKAIDNADVEREKSLRIYRQQLRDSTIKWVLPDNIL